MFITLPGLPGPSFYVESADRSCGIRVLFDAPVSEGSTVTLKDRMGRFGRERVVLADEVVVTGSAGVSSSHCRPLLSQRGVMPSLPLSRLYLERVDS